MTPAEMTPAAMYADTRVRLTDLFRSLAPAELETVVPATPAWTVGDVARHLAGGADDVLAGRIEGAATDPWTAAQVEARRATPIDDVLAEWEAKGPHLEGLIEAVGPPAFALILDVVTHEQDVRSAVGRPGARGTDAAAWSRQQLVGFLDGAIRRAEASPLRIVAGTDEYLLGGDGEPAATLTIEPFELLRALIGRRSVAQLRSYAWEGDAESFIPIMTVFPPALTDLHD